MIYRLDIDHPLTEENPYDAELIEFPGWGDVGFDNPEVDDYARGAPAVIEFVGNLERTTVSRRKPNKPASVLG